jgi:hypothetical protein
MIKTTDIHGAQVRLYQDAAELVSQRLYPVDDDNSEQIEWQGGTTAQAIVWAKEGRMELVPPSEKLLSKLETELNIVTTAAYQTVADVVGGAVNVPDYVAGVPTLMRRRVRVQRETAPITLIVSISASSGVSPETMQTRGTALLALARLLARSRPVTIWAGGVNHFGTSYSTNDADMRHDYTQVDISDLGRAAWLLADPTHNRAVRLRLKKNVTSHPSYASNPKDYRAALVDVFPGDRVYVFPRMGTGNPDEKLMLKDPTAWVIQRYNEMIAAAE